MTLTELREKRHEKAKAARDLLNAAEADKRELKPEERTQFDELDTQITELDGDIRRQERADELRGADDDDSGFAASTEEQRAAEAAADTDRALRSREAGGIADTREVQATLNEFREATYGARVQNKDDYRKAFYRYLTLLQSEVRAMDSDEYRVLSTATNPGGGYIVPQTFERTLIEKARDFGVMRQLATVLTTSTGEKITQPAEDTHGVASWIATNGAYAESDEAFLNVTLDAYKAGTLMRVAEELLQDSSFDLEGYIARQYAARIGILENTAYVVGDGVGKPTGVVTSAPVGVTLAAGNTTGFPAVNGGDPLVSLYHSVIMAYRNRGSWLMRDATVLKVRLLKDGQGQYLWRPGLDSTQPDSLLGRPLYTDPDMPAMAVSAKAVLFGDFSAYVIRDVAGVGIQRLVELYAGNGQVGFRGYHRTEGKLVNTGAIAALANSAT